MCTEFFIARMKAQWDKSDRWILPGDNTGHKWRGGHDVADQILVHWSQNFNWIYTHKSVCVCVCVVDRV
jgi:hypothetical protein